MNRKIMRLFVFWLWICNLYPIYTFLVKVPVGKIGKTSSAFRPFVQKPVFAKSSLKSDTLLQQATNLEGRNQAKLPSTNADDVANRIVLKLRRFMRCKYPSLDMYSVEQLKSVVENLQKHDLSLPFAKNLLNEFMEHNFQSFPRQAELAGHIKKQFRLTDDEIIKVFVRKPFLLTLSKKQFEEMVNYLQQNLTCSTKELKTFLLIRRLPESDLSLPNLQKYCSFLSEEYALPPAKIKSLLLRHPSVFCDQLIHHFAERKRILEDLFGPDTLKKNWFHLHALFGLLNIFVCPPEELYTMINLLMNIFQVSKVSEISSFIRIQAGILTCRPEYIQKKTDFYSSFFQGKKIMKSLHFPLQSSPSLSAPISSSSLVKGPRQPYKKIAKKLFKNDQIELEKKYQVKAWNVQPTTTHKKSVDENDLLQEKKKLLILQDDLTLYKDYLKTINRELEEEQDENNLYERLVAEVLEDYQKDGHLNLLKEIDPSFMEMIEEKLKNNGSSLTDLYRELWRESEGLQFSPAETLKLLKQFHVFGSTFRMLLTRIGALTAALGLRKTELMSILFVSMS
jgi:hypothetical protein